MRIGTVRLEEAVVFDSHNGYHQFEDGETREPYSSFEIFWEPGKGWFWWACFPGCIPNSEEPNGPFASSSQAYYDAQEG